jgi:hypothetical protein
LKLVEAIDYNLRNGTEHYYDTQGRLLRSLDEVINAALTDTLAPGKPVEQPERDQAVESLDRKRLHPGRPGSAPKRTLIHMESARLLIPKAIRQSRLQTCQPVGLPTLL